MYLQTHNHISQHWEIWHWLYTSANLFAIRLKINLLSAPSFSLFKCHTSHSLWKTPLYIHEKTGVEKANSILL